MIGNSSTKKPFFAWKVLRNLQTITKNNYRVYIKKKRNKGGNWKWKWKVWAETTPSSTSDGCWANQNWFSGGETKSALWRKVRSPENVKDSPDPSHFTYEINTGKRRIRQRTTLNSHNVISNRFWVDLEISHRCMSDPPLHDIDFKNKMDGVWSSNSEVQSLNYP